MTDTARLSGLTGEPLGKKLVSRFFTADGSTIIDVFDAVAGEIRDARIEDHRSPGGKPTFLQEDVEFPRSWSQNATNITAQKYFRGQLDSPSRENSVRQMIGRVARTITTWGVREGYFEKVGPNPEDTSSWGIDAVASKSSVAPRPETTRTPSECGTSLKSPKTAMRAPGFLRNTSSTSRRTKRASAARMTTLRTALSIASNDWASLESKGSPEGVFFGAGLPDLK